MLGAATSATPLEAGGEMFQRAKTPFMESRPSSMRPLSQATEIADSDYEDESEFEEYSPKGSFETDERRTSQTTLSSYDEAPTPSSSNSQRPFEMQCRPVEGPRGPHLFRSSQISAEFAWDHAMQMSPLLPKQPPPRTETAFSDETVTPVTRQKQLEDDFSIATALHNALNSASTEDDDTATGILSWTPRQVVDWLLSVHIDATVIDSFEHHDVDGVVLMGLQWDDLKELDIPSLGKRFKVWTAICELRGEERPSPQSTPFEDISRPCTTNPKRSPSRNRNACDTPIDAEDALNTPLQGRRRRGRKASKGLDVITPAESVSIVAIEQLIPRPHKCAKGERCAKWRKQQRELQQLKDDNGFGRFPISPGKGGRVFVRGDPGNVDTADNMIPNVRLQPSQDMYRPQSDAIPSVVASSDLLGPGQVPDFALHEDMLEALERRDPQDNVRAFLNFQHLNSPAPPLDDAPTTPPHEMFPARHFDPIKRAETVPPLNLPPQTQSPHQQLRNLPRLDIPYRSATAGPDFNTHSALRTAMPAESAATSVCRSVTASPTQFSNQVYRLGTPASEMDVPVTAIPSGPIARDTSASVPPNMQYRNHQPRSSSRADYFRRPSLALPAVKEGEVFSPASDPQTTSTRPSLSSSRSNSHDSTKSAPGLQRSNTVIDPAHDAPETKHFGAVGYGADCAHAGWMKKRKTKMLRHEWQDAHFRLHGTSLDMYANARLSSAAMDSLNIDDYAVACSSVASNSKLTAAMKAFKIKQDDAAKKAKEDPAAFAFQLVPALKDGQQHGSGKRHEVAKGKTHHFAVTTKDERIDWMRELMLAKALQQKGKGYDVAVNGVQA